MTKAQLDLAHRLVSELAIYAKAAGEYGHGGMTAAMRNAGALLQQMIEEAEANERELMRIVQSAANLDQQRRQEAEASERKSELFDDR